MLEIALVGIDGCFLVAFDSQILIGAEALKHDVNALAVDSSGLIDGGIIAACGICGGYLERIVHDETCGTVTLPSLENAIEDVRIGGECHLIAIGIGGDVDVDGAQGLVGCCRDDHSFLGKIGLEVRHVWIGLVCGQDGGDVGSIFESAESSFITFLI